MTLLHIVSDLVMAFGVFMAWFAIIGAYGIGLNVVQFSEFRQRNAAWGCLILWLFAFTLYNTGKLLGFLGEL